MKRSRNSLQPVPLDGLEGLLFQQPKNISPDENAEWFKIVRNFEDDDFETDEEIESSEDGDVAHVYVYDEIGGWFGVTASDFIKSINKLDVKKIYLHINSPGGSIFDGVAIYNALLQHEAEVVVSIDSLAASAASFIAQAGDEVIMRRASTMMIHDGSMIAWGDAAYLRDQANILDKLSNNIASIYAARTGGSAEEWRAVMIGEAWYTADEAVDAGLADRVDGAGEKAENKFDLSMFMHAGRENAPSPELIRQNVMQNRLNKENAVTQKITVTNDQSETPVSDEGEETVVGPGEAEGSPDSPDSPDSPESPESADHEDENEAEDEEVQQDTQPTVPENRASRGGAFMVNGAPESSRDTVQSHINSLEGFYNESRSMARKDFVESLVKNGQIAAPQAESFTEMVALEHMSDEQFDRFKASYENAPQLPLLARHGNQHSAEDSAADKAQQDRIEVLQAIVDRHKASGLRAEQIEKTDSYNELQVLLEKQAGQGS